MSRHLTSIDIQNKHECYNNSEKTKKKFSRSKYSEQISNYCYLYNELDCSLNKKDLNEDDNEGENEYSLCLKKTLHASINENDYVGFVYLFYYINS